MLPQTNMISQRLTTSSMIAILTERFIILELIKWKYLYVVKRLNLNLRPALQWQSHNIECSLKWSLNVKLEFRTIWLRKRNIDGARVKSRVWTSCFVTPSNGHFLNHSKQKIRWRPSIIIVELTFQKLFIFLKNVLDFVIIHNLFVFTFLGNRCFSVMTGR